MEISFGLVSQVKEKSEGELEKSLREVFGEPIYEYTDGQAVADGILMPFIVKQKDTGHRITRNALAALKDHYSERGYRNYSDGQFYRFFSLPSCYPWRLRQAGVRTWRHAQNRLRFQGHESGSRGSVVPAERNQGCDLDAAE